MTLDTLWDEELSSPQCEWHSSIDQRPSPVLAPLLVLSLVLDHELDLALDRDLVIVLDRELDHEPALVLDPEPPDSSPPHGSEDLAPPGRGQSHSGQECASGQGVGDIPSSIPDTSCSEPYAKLNMSVSVFLKLKRHGEAGIG